MMRSGLVTIVLALAAGTAHAQSGVRSVEFGKTLNTGKQTKLVGFVDLHTHPLNHISFGGKVFHGAPGTGVWMPKDMRGCGKPAGPAVNREEALADCAPTHKIVARGCGNVWRGIGVWALEDENHAQSEHGKPALVGKKSWPAHDDITHQQMWVEWTERAYKGGLRVMVALVTNNKMLADGVRGEDTDDTSAIRRAIPETKKWVASQPWMEVAYSAADVRRIVGKDRMAVILGTEVDDIGDMVAAARAGRSRATDAQVRKHIRDLHGMGVRYMFPLHVVDNLFGGTAAYRSAFDLANRYLAGFYWTLRCAPGYVFDHKVKALPKIASGLNLAMDISEHNGVAKCAPGKGHVNARGLTRRGAAAIDEMMRLGMFIDVDHMSHAAIGDTIAIARAFHGGYPLVSGHSSLLDDSGEPDEDHYGQREDKKRAAHYQAIRELGGIVGIEWDSTSEMADSRQWLREAGRVMTYAGTAIAFGTDINGMVVQPKPPGGRPVKYAPESNLPRPRANAADARSRAWDYNTDGMVHYGMITDFLTDVQQLPAGPVRVRPVGDDARTPRAPGARTQLSGADVVDALFGGAEALARTWERAEAKAGAARRAPRERLPADVREIPATVIGPLCPTQHTGNREFNGHGPEFTAEVNLRIVDGADALKMKRQPGVAVGGSALVARVAFEAKQTKLGKTRAWQTWDVVIASAPRGMRFARILGPPEATTGKVRGISGKGGFQFVVARQPPASMWLTPDSGDAVDEFIVVGDTGGLDISTDEDCRDDTSVTVATNPVRVKLAPVADQLVDALDVRIETGADDIRGGPGSAFVRIVYAGGRSAEVDVTSIGKKKNRGGTVRIPLGRRVKVSDLRTLELRHISNDCIACKTDHWQVSSIVARAPGVGTVLAVPRFDIAHTTRSFAFR